MADNDELLDYDDDEPTGGIDRKVVLYALGGMVALALVLAVLRARTAPRTQNPITVDLGPDADWRVSLEHLAAAFDVRLTGVDARLDDLAGATVASRAAAFSAPVAGLSDENSAGVVERVPPVMDVGANEPAAPSPASVSLPPETVEVS